MNRIAFSGLLSAALLTIACGGAEAPAETRAAPGATTDQQPMGGMMGGRGGMHGGGMMMADADCPMMIPSVQVEAADVEGGAAMTFTTTAADRIGDLRSRVRRMAAMMEAHDQARSGGRGMHGAMMPASHANVVDIEGGARLELQALETADVGALRAHVRQHGESMRAGACPMTMMHGAAG